MGTSKRTEAQNNALHKYCEDVANALNDAGITFTMFFKPGYEVPWSKYIVKENVWKPVLEAMFDVESTTQMEKSDVDKVYEVVNRKLSEYGVHVPFPKRDEQ